MTRRIIAAAGTILLLSLGMAPPAAAQAPRPKKVVFLPGPLDAGHPRGTHEYEKTARLLKHGLDHSPLAKEIRTEIYPGGWPDDPRVLDDADTIVVISSGADRRAEDHPLLVGDRLQTLAKQMRRGCGLVAIHWALFVPAKNGDLFLDWIGGYFDYEKGQHRDGRAWYSKIQTTKAQAIPATLRHPVARGLKPFDVREEFYYNIRFRPADPRLTPILNVRIPGEPDLQTVAWAVERKGGGRGFGFTGGHFLDNWQIDGYRRMVLNAIVWTAGGEVPKGGIPSELPAANQPAPPAQGAAIRALIVTGNNHPAHDWRKTTAALEEVLGSDKRFRVEVTAGPESLAKMPLRDFDVIVMNYCNWEGSGLSAAAKKNLLAYLNNGGGLSIIHFANGAFHFSLPKAADSDWPEWRTRICRRVWDHTPGKSGHDALGKFKVEIRQLAHPITQGLASFDTVDELYFRQQGDEPITVLATARSQVTKQDEPMAFVANYGKARIFQTVLGHDAAALRTPGTAALIRRGTAWAAGRVPAEPGALAPGKFGQALDARRNYVQIPHRPEYKRLPLTVECWAKLDSKKGFNVLVASAPKESADHWEIYSYVGSGFFSAYLPGYAPAEIKSDRDVTDGRWHQLALTFDGKRVRLFVDAQLVKDAPITRLRDGGPDGPLWIGGYPPANIGCDGLVDEVKISAAVGKGTVGLWHLDDTKLADASRLANPGKLVPQGTTPPAGPSSSTQLDYAPADKRLKAVLIDRSPAESYVAVKADTEGRLFVGGREALFVFDPQAGGRFAKTELFRFPPDSWIAGIELRGNDLYVLTAAALYRFPDGRLKRGGLWPERLVWGLPLDLHVSFHSLAWGPEGDLYLNHGDPLLTHGDFNRPDHWGHWTLFTQPEGTKVSYTGVGAVLKVRPDGSNLRVVATGLRGCFGMSFDRNWDLFTNDNDHESIPDRYTPGRLLHVTPHIDFGWPRGWIASKTPDRADLIEPLVNSPGRGVPVGLAYYDDAFLPAEYRHNLLQDRWDRLAIFRYPLTPRGASLSAQELPFLIGRDKARPIGVTVGRGGRVFATISYMAGNEGSPHYASDLVMMTRAGDGPEAPFDAYDVTSASAEKLWAELGNPSWQRRLNAHTEILRRGAPVNDAPKRLALAKVGDPVLPHLIWLVAATQREDGAAMLKRWAQGTQPMELRRQAIRALATFPALKGDDALFTRALADAEPSVRLAALVAFFDRSRKLPVAAVAHLAHSEDTYLRQTAARLLAERATPAQLDTICMAKDAPTRLAGVLAVGLRLTTPPQTAPPASIKLAYRETSAFFSVNIRYGDAADKPVDLRKLGPVGSFTTADYWKAVRTADGEALFALLQAGLSDPSEPVRLQAAYWLSLLRDPRTEAAIANVALNAKQDRLAGAPARAVGKVWLVGPFSDSAKAARPSQGVIDLTADYDGAAGKVRWQEAVAKDGRVDLKPAAGQSYYVYFQVQSAARQPALLKLGGGIPDELWHNSRRSPAAAEPVLLDLQPGGNDLLLRVGSGNAALELSVRTRAPVVLALPEKLGLATLAQRLKAGGTEKVDPAFLTIDWPAEARKGDARNGRKLFGSLGCVKCHAITADQKGGGGPSLTEAGKRFTVAQMVESVLLPSKQVAELFRTTRLVTTSGEVVAGLVVGETADAIELLLPDTTRRTVRKVDVEERTLTTVSPMPAGLVRTPAELRDVLAYLLSDNPLPP